MRNMSRIYSTILRLAHPLNYFASPRFNLSARILRRATPAGKLPASPFFAMPALDFSTCLRKFKYLDPKSRSHMPCRATVSRNMTMASMLNRPFCHGWTSTSAISRRLYYRSIRSRICPPRRTCHPPRRTCHPTRYPNPNPYPNPYRYPNPNHFRPPTRTCHPPRPCQPNAARRDALRRIAAEQNSITGKHHTFTTLNV